MKKMLLTSLLLGATLISNTFAEEDVPKWKQKQLERKAEREAENGGAPTDRLGLGFEGSLVNGGPGIALSKYLSPELKLQGFLDTYNVAKQKDQDAGTTIQIGARILQVIKKTENVELTGGLGISYLGRSKNAGDFSDIAFEAPLRFEYFVTERFSVSISGGIVFYTPIFESNDASSNFNLSGGNLGSAGVHFWL